MLQTSDNCQTASRQPTAERSGARMGPLVVELVVGRVLPRGDPPAPPLPPQPADEDALCQLMRQLLPLRAGAPPTSPPAAAPRPHPAVAAGCGEPGDALRLQPCRQMPSAPVGYGISGIIAAHMTVATAVDIRAVRQRVLHFLDGVKSRSSSDDHLNALQQDWGGQRGSGGGREGGAGGDWSPGILSWVPQWGAAGSARSCPGSCSSAGCTARNPPASGSRTSRCTGSCTPAPPQERPPPAACTFLCNAWGGARRK